MLYLIGLVPILWSFGSDGLFKLLSCPNGVTSCLARDVFEREVSSRKRLMLKSDVELRLLLISFGDNDCG